MTYLTAITETNQYIVLDQYEKIQNKDTGYQTEAELEREFIQDLVSQGYEHMPAITSAEAMFANVRVQLENLNQCTFSDSEWHRYVQEYLDCPNEGILDKTRKLHEKHLHDFTFDDGTLKNIRLVDKKNIARNKLQVISQYENTGTQANRYDVTILVNGLPLVHIELKKRGVAIQEAFNQVHRYSKESFNSDNSLYKYLQIFVISNGTDTRYFANTVSRNKNSYDFTMNWANAKNEPIKDLKDFTVTFFQRHTLLDILINYTVFNTQNILLIMRPYQIAATERILNKIHIAHQTQKWSKPESGGYIWHTTGSGKTLTSFKAAKLATQLNFIDKVIFVVDRKDLDTQTMLEYKKFSPDSVNGSSNTAGLRKNLEEEEQLKEGETEVKKKIVVTTIQKLNQLIKNEKSLSIYQKQVVFIFDECHRSQFGEAQKNLQKKFKKYCQFGFTGTPILTENANGTDTTAGVFGRELHTYIITDAIRDEKVLRFKVDYNDVRPQFKTIEREIDEKKLSAAENKQALLHPQRIDEISRYILTHYKAKTNRLKNNTNGFNAMFAVSSVDAAKCYYEAINKLQRDHDKPLKIATIFSFAANEEQQAIGTIEDEDFNPTAMNLSAKEFLSEAINDYNQMFKTNFGVDSKGFENYYKDLSNRTKRREIDLLIVVGMFLTGFDAPRMNTLFVDKNLRYHGLIQAFSRTNRIYDSNKPFGNIVTFRDLEQATIDAITLFGDTNTRNVILEKSYKEYMEGFKDIITGEAHRGYIEIIKTLNHRFPEPEQIEKESEKKEFVKLFGEYLRVENILRNYDEFQGLQNSITETQVEIGVAAEQPKVAYETAQEVPGLKNLDIPSDRQLQDYKSTYNDIRDWLRQKQQNKTQEDSGIDWNEVVFEVDLLKSQEIDLDYILELVLEHNKKHRTKESLIEEIQRTIRSSIGNRAKEQLVIDFIKQTDLDKIEDKSSIIDAFYHFAQQQLKKEAAHIIDHESLKQEEAKRYITTSLHREYASDNGTDLSEILPKMSPLNPQYLTKKQSVFEKIGAFVEKFKGIGGTL
ncbi:type I restriction endonuclease subunit R [Halosquirtibacter laminarini]|uniref:Type I restriction endonuclease subunit R n=1 Tax=Halosquirtibacter laminarini TaxID=3374600 RepID=A0AC61NJ90_9BACT|nr:type I restriction endonuclease subunit R [Prolixibacteraceae bacterium]